MSILDGVCAELGRRQIKRDTDPRVTLLPPHARERIVVACDNYPSLYEYGRAFEMGDADMRRASHGLRDRLWDATQFSEPPEPMGRIVAHRFSRGYTTRHGDMLFISQQGVTLFPADGGPARFHDYRNSMLEAHTAGRYAWISLVDTHAMILIHASYYDTVRDWLVLWLSTGWVVVLQWDDKTQRFSRCMDRRARIFDVMENQICTLSTDGSITAIAQTDFRAWTNWNRVGEGLPAVHTAANDGDIQLRIVSSVLSSDWHVVVLAYPHNRWYVVVGAHASTLMRTQVFSVPMELDEDTHFMVAHLTQDQKLLLGDNKGILYLWDLAGERLLSIMDDAIGGAVKCIASSHDSRRLAVLSATHMLRMCLWDDVAKTYRVQRVADIYTYLTQPSEVSGFEVMTISDDRLIFHDPASRWTLTWTFGPPPPMK